MDYIFNESGSRISSALNTIKEWFDKRIEDSKDILSKTKEKIETSFRKVIGKVKEPEKVSKLKKITNSVKSAFLKLKQMCMNIIKWCKEALSSLISIERVDPKEIARTEERLRKREEKLNKIKENKEKVMNGLSEVTHTVQIIGTLIIGIGAIYAGTNKIREIKNKA